MNAKHIIIFLGGLISGSGIGILATREYFKKEANKRADKEIAEMEIYYSEEFHKVLNILPEKERENLKEGYGFVNPHRDYEPSEELKEAIEKASRNYVQTTNYAKMYSKKLERGELTDDEKEEIEAEHEYPTEDDNVEETMEKLGRAATEDHKANMNRPPKIISEESLGELPTYVDQKTLFFYAIDEVLTDEEDEVIDDPDYIIGDCLDKYNFRESDEKIIFVRNFALDTVYEIQKVNAAFEGDE